MAEGGSDNDDIKDNLGYAGNTKESQYPDEFEYQFTDHRKMIPGRDERPRSKVSSTKSKDSQTKCTKLDH